MFAADILQRHDFRTGDFLLGPVSCCLCGPDLDSEEDLVEHLQVHVSGGGVDSQRLLEEYRKRMLYHEEVEGPFPASGAELRRAASNHSWHSTHSYLNGSDAPTYIKKSANGEEKEA